VASARDFRIANRFAFATTALMFGLIVLGSVVRTTGSGLACPDWPLCHGRIIPPLQFNVMIEWVHRLVALLVSVLLAATSAWVFARGAVRARLGGLVALALGLLAAQILLGALTVWKLLDPGVVGGHLAVALLLFSTMVTITLVAGREANPGNDSALRRPAGLLPLFTAVTIATYLQAVLGGIVSTHHASLACPDWPTCNGAWFPPMDGLVGLQMLHRWGAYTLVALMLAAATRARASADPAIQRGGLTVLRLTLLQVVFGVANVFLAIPVWMSALHLATATAILAFALTLTFRAASSRAVHEQPVPAR
jgi:cytochrome c oxidase assembly protein subunit 15